MEGFYPVKHWMVGYNLMLWDVKKSRCGGEGGKIIPRPDHFHQIIISSLSYYNYRRFS